MFRVSAPLVILGLATLPLQGCVIVNAPPTGSTQQPWRAPQVAVPTEPSPRQSAATASCPGATRSAAQIFAAASAGVAVVSGSDRQGSAFVVAQEGGRTLLLTNSHVVGSDDAVEVRWSDGRRDRAQVIADAGGAAPATDLALLAVEGQRGTALPLAAALPAVGQSVYAIGAPKGLEFSLSSGVVSQLRDGGELVQTDAALNGGNSGGPLLDDRGCVVGIATFIYNESQGLNFAVSSQVIRPFVQAPLIARDPALPPPPASAASGLGDGSEASRATCFFHSFKKTQGEEIGCSVNGRLNSHGHTVYDVAWADGYRSTYVFWSDGVVEILSKGGSGRVELHRGSFTRRPDGVEISSNEGSLTVLPQLQPVLN
jgi:S1-C subfamily serine protease